MRYQIKLFPKFPTIAFVVGILITAAVTALPLNAEECNCSRIDSGVAPRIDPLIEPVIDEKGEARVMVLFRAVPEKKGFGKRKHGKNITVRELMDILAPFSPTYFNGNPADRTGLSPAGIEVEIDELFEYNNGFSGWINRNGLEKLKKHPLLKAMSLDPIMVPNLLQSIPQIGADQVHTPSPAGDAPLTGKQGLVIILDTGLDYTHPAFGGCSLEQIMNGTCDRIPASYNAYARTTDAMDSYGHGTHVAGIVAANGPVVTGTAPGVRILPVKICDDQGSCPGSKMLAGFEWALEWYLLHREEYGYVVVTTSISIPYSFTDPVCPGWFETTLKRMHEAGLTITVCAGNQGASNGMSYPACSPYTISVGNVDKNDVVVRSGNRDSRLDLWAPGLSIYSTLPGNSYGYKSGTSMSAPHVAGAVILLAECWRLEKGTVPTPDSLLDLLSAAGMPVTDNVSGLTRPRVDVNAAVNMLRGPDQKSNVPVEIVSYTAEISGTDVILEWQTQSEQNNLGFHIYRSATKNGDYARLTNGIIPGAGTTSLPRFYQLTDAEAGPGTWYYRLEQVNSDGSRETVGSVTVTFAGPLNIIYSRAQPLEVTGLSVTSPHPRLQAVITAPKAGRYDLVVINAAGEYSAARECGRLGRGESVSVTRELSPGFHLAVLRGPDGNTVRRLIIK